MESVATIFLALLGLYLLGGIVFAIPFAFLAAKKIDPAAIQGTFAFKLLIIPGAAIFWPLLIRRWLTQSPPPEECSSHRKLARSQPTSAPRSGS